MYTHVTLPSYLYVHIANLTLRATNQTLCQYPELFARREKGVYALAALVPGYYKQLDAQGGAQGGPRRKSGGAEDLTAAAARETDPLAKARLLVEAATQRVGQLRGSLTKVLTGWCVGICCFFAHLLVFSHICWCLRTCVGVFAHVLVFPHMYWCFRTLVGVSAHLLVFPHHCWCFRTHVVLSRRCCNDHKLR